MTLIASAGPLVTEAEPPTGDVWITPDAPAAAPTQSAQRTPGQRQQPTGDFWPADDGATRAADAPAPPHDRSAAREEVATGAVK